MLYYYCYLDFRVEKYGHIIYFFFFYDELLLLNTKDWADIPQCELPCSGHTFKIITNTNFLNTNLSTFIPKAINYRFLTVYINIVFIADFRGIK